MRKFEVVAQAPVEAPGSMLGVCVERTIGVVPRRAAPGGLGWCGWRDGETQLRASDQQYDVVVLDVMLPKLLGYEVVKRLRARHVWTPILMLTAQDRTDPRT